jgi:hypothetical protein
MKRIVTLLTILAVAGGMAGCGAASHTSTVSTQSEEAKGREAAHQFAAKLEACEGERRTNLAWSEAIQRVIQSYSVETDTANYQALAQADEKSYQVEVADKKIAVLIPSTAEAVARYNASLGTVRRAEGEGVRALAAALPEATAAVKVLTAACEAGAG